MLDCRKVPSDNSCTRVIAGTEDEVLEAAVVLWFSAPARGSPELREMLRAGLTDAESSPWLAVRAEFRAARRSEGLFGDNCFGTLTGPRPTG